MNSPIYYLNGQYVPAAQAVLPITDLAILRGYGIFDYLRTYNGIPFKLNEHLARLQYSADQIGLTLPCSLDEISGIVQEVIRRNTFAETGLRIIVTGGVGLDAITPGDSPSLAVMAGSAARFADSLYENGATAITTSLERSMPTVKSLDYLPGVLALRQAKAVGAVEALYRNRDGVISEGTTTNFFIVTAEGQLVTPVEGILIGMTRNVVIELICERFEIVERPITADDLKTCREAFLTSTSKEVMPVVKVDHLIIGSGTPGEHTQWIRQAFRTLTDNHH